MSEDKEHSRWRTFSWGDEECSLEFCDEEDSLSQENFIWASENKVSDRLWVSKSLHRERSSIRFKIIWLRFEDKECSSASSVLNAPKRIFREKRKEKGKRKEEKKKKRKKRRRKGRKMKNKTLEIRRNKTKKII